MGSHQDTSITKCSPRPIPSAHQDQDQALTKTKKKPTAMKLAASLCMLFFTATLVQGSKRQGNFTKREGSKRQGPKRTLPAKSSPWYSSVSSYARSAYNRVTALPGKALEWTLDKVQEKLLEDQLEEF